MLFIVYERPQFVQLENPLRGRWWLERRVQFGEASRFFLIQLVTV